MTLPHLFRYSFYLSAKRIQICSGVEKAKACPHSARIKCAECFMPESRTMISASDAYSALSKKPCDVFRASSLYVKSKHRALVPRTANADAFYITEPLASIAKKPLLVIAYSLKSDLPDRS